MITKMGVLDQKRVATFNDLFQCLFWTQLASTEHIAAHICLIIAKLKQKAYNGNCSLLIITTKIYIKSTVISPGSMIIKKITPNAGTNKCNNYPIQNVDIS